VGSRLLSNHSTHEPLSIHSSHHSYKYLRLNRRSNAIDRTQGTYNDVHLLAWSLCALPESDGPPTKHYNNWPPPVPGRDDTQIGIRLRGESPSPAPTSPSLPWASPICRPNLNVRFRKTGYD